MSMSKKIKLTILDSETVTKGDVSLDGIAALAESRVFGYTPNEKVAEVIGDSDAVICNKCLITEEVFAACPDLKYVGLFATGYNNVDLEAADRRGAAVCNVPAYSTYAVAQHTFALILDHYSRAAEYEKDTADGGWIDYKLLSRFYMPTFELYGRTIGIVGYGDIGSRVGAIALAFGMNVLTYTRTPARVTDGTETVSFEELLRRSDIVSLHCPLTADNEKMINAETLALMKPDALLVNTARGGLIDEPALAEALNGGVIAAAKLDCLTLEPMRADCPLYGVKNCGITPHIAWAPIETRVRLLREVEENLRAWINGAPRNVVNLKGKE